MNTIHKQHLYFGKEPYRPLRSRNSEGQFQIFSAAGVVPNRELWPYETNLEFARA